MDASRHPVALRLERQVRGATRLFATVMGLPLIDGIFSALIIARALTTTAGNLSVAGILQTGLLIFDGSATVAVILAKMDGTRREWLTSILLLGALFIPVAVAGVAVVETIEALLNSEVSYRFADLVILAVAAKTASSKVDEYLPSPSIIIGFGLVMSFEPAGFELIVTPDPMCPLSAGAVAGMGVGLARAVALFAPRLRGNVDIDLSRFGSSVALGTLVPDVLGPTLTQALVVLGVLVVAASFAFDPGFDGADLNEFVDDASTTEPVTSNANANGAVADGGDDADLADYDVLVDDASKTDDDSEPGYDYPSEGESCAPRL